MPGSPHFHLMNGLLAQQAQGLAMVYRGSAAAGVAARLQRYLSDARGDGGAVRTGLSTSEAPTGERFGRPLKAIETREAAEEA